LSNTDSSLHFPQVLWWATRLTFNSARVYRHMARVLAAAGDAALARRFLRLYVQVVSKARETIAAEEQQKREDRRHGAERAGVAGIEPGDPHPPGLQVEMDGDSDEEWVRTLVHGARMLCRVAEEKARGRGRGGYAAGPSTGASGAGGGGRDVMGDGREEAREAAGYLERAREVVDLRAEGRDDAVWTALRASVDLAEGVCVGLLPGQSQGRFRSPPCHAARRLITSLIPAQPDRARSRSARDRPHAPRSVRRGVPCARSAPPPRPRPRTARVGARPLACGAACARGGRG
jgi:hypothetical protein